MVDCYQCDVTTEDNSNWFKKDILIVGRLQGIQETQDQGGSQASWGSRDKNQKAFLKQSSYFPCIHWSGPLCSLQTDVLSSEWEKHAMTFPFQLQNEDLLASLYLFFNFQVRESDWCASVRDSDRINCIPRIYSLRMGRWMAGKLIHFCLHTNTQLNTYVII